MEVLRTIRAKQAEKIPVGAFTGMTQEQAKNFGTPFSVPDGQKDDKDARSKALDTHPCKAAVAAVHVMDKTARLALESHCKLKPSAAARSVDVSLAKVAVCSAILAALFTL